MRRVTVRKIKRSFAENKIKILIVMIISLFFIFATGYAYFTTDLRIGGEATIIDDNIEELVCDYDLTGELESVHSWYEGDKYRTKTNVTITNNSDEAVYGWEMKIGGQSGMEITFSNAEYLIADGYYVLTPVSWLDPIPAQGSISFEITFAHDEEEFAVKFLYVNDCKLLGNGSLVDDPTSDRLKKIILAPLEETLNIGESVALIATKVPAHAPGTVVFASNSPNVATVDQNGIVTAINTGIAVITARIDNVVSSSTIYVVDEEVVENKIFDFVFTTGYVNRETNQVQFRIDIRNLTNVSYSKISFDISLPDNTIYDLWNNPGFTITDNRFVLNMQWGNMIDPQGSIFVDGNITIPLPEKVSDYLNPIISNVKILE